MKPANTNSARRKNAILGALSSTLLRLTTVVILLWLRSSLDPGAFAAKVLLLLIVLGKKFKEEKKMLLLNIDHVPGKEIEALGLVKGTVVQSKNFGKDFMAGMKTLVGGEITGYTEMLIEARQIATKRMVDEAQALGADAVVNVRYGSSSVMQGAAEVIAYGTAVKLL